MQFFNEQTTEQHTMNFRELVDKLQQSGLTNTNYLFDGNKILITVNDNTIATVDAFEGIIVVRPLPTMNAEQLSLLNAFNKQTDIDATLSNPRYKYFVTTGVLDDTGVTQVLIVPGQTQGKYAFVLAKNLDDDETDDEGTMYDVREIMKIAAATNVAVIEF